MRNGTGGGRERCIYPEGCIHNRFASLTVDGTLQALQQSRDSSKAAKEKTLPARDKQTFFEGAQLTARVGSRISKIASEVIAQGPCARCPG